MVADTRWLPVVRCACIIQRSANFCKHLVGAGASAAAGHHGVVERLLIAGVVIVVAVLIALVIDRRTPDAPTAPRWAVPTQLDRADFAGAGQPWLVAVFTSETCDACAGTAAKASVLASDDVAVDEVAVGVRPQVHRRYAIDAVPTVVVADAEGVVRASFVGPPTATDLWAAVAELRDPGAEETARG